ncbi:Hypothetical predicted protein [Mytilus galloprovincialis]|uniref:RING-type domain-containing protein n=1 Tax=Mytilus galloprovincialis TaxID=29158 RepID=A0A8B6DW87_MYTGA|nr:Hypothetical predicted protein [Mytilus galloprovincialis]
MSDKSGGELIVELQQRYLECGICTEAFDEENHIPKLLPCLHTFCLKCISSLHNRKTLTCPLCKKTHDIKTNDFSCLPKDNTRRDLTAFLEKFAKHYSERCNICMEITKIVCKCENCSVNICSQCKSRHKREKPMHTLTKIAHNLETVKDDEIYKKKGHENGCLKFFCRSSTCQKILCAICAITEHWSHEVEDINLTFNHRRESVQKLLAHFKKRVVSVKVLEHRSKMKIDHLLNQSHRYNEKVQLVSSKGIQSVYDKAQRIIERVRTSEKERMIHLHKDKKIYSVYLENATECCNTIEQLLQTASAISFITLEPVVIENLHHLLNIELEKIEIPGTNRTGELDALVTAYEDIIERFHKTTLDPGLTDGVSCIQTPTPLYNQPRVSVLYDTFSTFADYCGKGAVGMFMLIMMILFTLYHFYDKHIPIWYSDGVRIEDLELGNDEHDKDNEEILFEIGLTNKNIHMSYLCDKKEHAWVVYGAHCGDGVCVRYNDRIAPPDFFLKGENSSGLWEVYFSLWFQPEKETLLIISNFSTHSFTNISGNNRLWPVYAIYYNNSLTSISIISSSPSSQSFQKSTLSEGLYISFDSKTLANRKKLNSQNITLLNAKSTYIFTKSVNMNRFKSSMFALEIRFDGNRYLPNNTILFEMGFLYNDLMHEEGGNIIFVNYDYKQNTSTYNIGFTDGSSAIFKNAEGVSSILIRVILHFNVTASECQGHMNLVSGSGILTTYMSFRHSGLGTFPQFFIRKRCTFCTPIIRADIKQFTLFDLKNILLNDKFM